MKAHLFGIKKPISIRMRHEIGKVPGLKKRELDLFKTRPPSMSPKEVHMVDAKYDVETGCIKSATCIGRLKFEEGLQLFDVWTVWYEDRTPDGLEYPNMQVPYKHKLIQAKNHYSTRSDVPEDVLKTINLHLEAGIYKDAGK